MSQSKMSFNATWAMAVGGMVGGGIFSVLGVIIESAGQWAWLSFVLAGMIALISAHSYSQLALKYNEGGGAFTFLRKINHEGFAGSLSWVLILGYVLTLSVYAYTFGHYVAQVMDFGEWFPRFLAILVITMLTVVNLRGVGDASRFEIITVYGKLLVLMGVAAFGIYMWSPERLVEGIEPKPWTAALLGAATIFVAYEGFQLLSYDYEDLQNPTKTLPRATILAVLSVIAIYVLVVLGATMVVGAETIIEQKEVALSVVGKQAMGIWGLILVTVAAAFSTGSAINATLFSTARLMENVAQKRDLPHIFVKENRQNIPYYSVITVATTSAILAITGSLNGLVDAASIIFLFTFGVVNCIAYDQSVKWKWLCFIGALFCFVAILMLSWEIVNKSPYALLSLFGLVTLLVTLRPYVNRKWA